MGVPSTVVTSLVPDTADNASLSYSVLSYLKRLKTQAKTEYDRYLGKKFFFFYIFFTYILFYLIDYALK